MSDKKQYCTLENNKFFVIDSLEGEELDVKISFNEGIGFVVNYYINNKHIIAEMHACDTSSEGEMFYHVDGVVINPSYVTAIHSCYSDIRFMRD